MTRIERLHEHRWQSAALRRRWQLPPSGSFDEFYRCERPRLDVFVRRMGATWEEAKDIAQDTMLAAFIHWKEITNPRAWVRVAAVTEVPASAGTVAARY